MTDVDKWFATLVTSELERLHKWNESQQREIDKLKVRQAIIWFVLATCGTLAGILLGAIFS